MKDLNAILSDYLAKGFGSMNKNDFEVYLFHLLIHEPGLMADISLLNKSDYEISIRLGIPISKVTRLRYEANLKHNQQIDYRRELASVLSTAKFKKGDSGKIQMRVSDKMLYQWIDSQLQRDGRFPDTSFNRNILVLSVDDLAYLLETVFYTEEQKAEIRDKARAALKEPAPTVGSAVKWTLKQLAQSGREIAGSLAASQLVPLLASLA